MINVCGGGEKASGRKQPSREISDERPLACLRDTAGDFRLEITPELRLRDEMYALQQTTEWKDRYGIRSGIEATNSELKRSHGIGKLRVRRLPRVCLAVALKVTACNIKRWAKALISLGRLIYGCPGTVHLVLTLSWADVGSVPAS